MRWLDKSGHQVTGYPKLPVEKAAEIMIFSKKDLMPLNLLYSSNLVQQELSHMKTISRSLLYKTVKVILEVMQMLGRFLERGVNKDNPEWTAAMASSTVSEKVRIKPSRHQHKENEMDCRTVVQ